MSLEVEQLVWARFETFAFWPAQVYILFFCPQSVFEKSTHHFQVLPRDSPEGEGVDGVPASQRTAGEYLVRFFGTYDIAWVKASNVVPYEVCDFSLQNSKLTTKGRNIVCSSLLECHISGCTEGKYKNIGVSSFLAEHHFFWFSIFWGIS